MKNATATRPNFRTNKDQEVNFYGYEVSTVKFMGTCPVSGIRMYDMPGSPYPDHDFSSLVAKEHGMSGPDFFISYLASNDRQQSEKGLALAKKTWFPLPSSIGPVKDVRIAASTYYDKTNSNPYFCADVYANGVKVLTLPRQYGNDSQIDYEATKALDKAGFIELEKYANGASEGPQRWADRTGATLVLYIYKATYNEFYQRGIYAA